MKRGSSRRLTLEPRSLAVAMIAPPLPGRHLLGGPLDGLDDVVVAGAAAEVAFQPVADLGLRRPRRALEELGGRHDHARRAEAALQAVLFPEAFLDRMQLAVLGHALDGLHLRALALDGQERTGLHRQAVDVHGAGAALAGVAAHVGAGEPRELPDVVDEEEAGLDVVGILHAVDGHGDGCFHRMHLPKDCGDGDHAARTGNGVVILAAASPSAARAPDPGLVMTVIVTTAVASPVRGRGRESASHPIPGDAGCQEAVGGAAPLPICTPKGAYNPMSRDPR